jgi:hypothetical protein
MPDDDVTLSTPTDKFLRAAGLSDSEKLGIRNRIGAASAADLSAAVADIATNAGDIADAVADIATHTGTLADHDVAITGLEDALAAAVADIADNTDDIADIVATINASVTGVASVAGLTGVVTSSALRSALNVENGADVTDAANIASSIAGAAEKVTPADDDKVPALDSAASGALKWFKISSIVTKVLAAVSTFYATAAQGAKADTAVQPDTDATLSSLALTPVALEDLPEANTVEVGTIANINDGSVAGLGEVAMPGGSIEQRVRSDGAAWIVDSGVGVSDHGLLDGLADDDHTQYLRTNGARACTGIQELLGIKLTAPTELTISSGAVTATRSAHRIDTQSNAASDDLDTITPATGAGDLLILVPEDDTRTVVLKNGTGNIRTFDGNDITLDSDDHWALLFYVGTRWVAMSNSGGGAGNLKADGTVAGTAFQELLGLNFTDPTILTLASDTCTVTRTMHFIAAQTGIADDLVTLTATPGVGTFLILAADTGDTITIKHGTGNIRTFDGADTTITSTSPAILFRMGTNWLCVKNNAGGGGGGGGGGVLTAITDHFGGTSVDLDSLTSAPYATGQSVSFRDSNYHLWTYILRAGAFPGGNITSVDTGDNTLIAESNADFTALIPGDRVVFYTTGTLPAPLVPFTPYFVLTIPLPTQMRLSATLMGPAIDITTAGTGSHTWARYLVPYRVRPSDYNALTRAFYWERVYEKWDYFTLSFLAFAGTVTLSSVVMARHPFDFEILGWGVAVDMVISPPGSGSGGPLICNLQKTTTTTSNPAGTNLSAYGLQLNQYEFYKKVWFTRPEHIISFAEGEGVVLNIISAGSVPPQGLEVHLWCRRPSTSF